MTRHGHNRRPRNYNRAFAVGIALNAVFIVVEVAYGFLSDSLALLADAGHNLGDVMGLLVAWAAAYLSQRKPTRKHTYGLKRSSILAALANAVFLLVSVGAISWEAVRRLREPAAVHVETVVWVALLGIVVNTATALMFMKGQQEDLNIRGAFLHMLADAAISAGVVAAGLAIARTGIMIIDPLVSIIIAVIIFAGTWKLLRESLNLALDAVPAHIDAAGIRAYLRGLPSVKNVHHMHVWGLSTTHAALTAHIVLENPVIDNQLLARIREELRELHGIEHTTIQFESGAEAICPAGKDKPDICRDGGHA
jgi:cobalt-zinc-cadmium efflux system protein